MKKIIFMILILNPLFSLDIEYDYELTNPYYMNVNMYFPISDEKVEIINESNEFILYKNLLIGSIIPKFVYLEASLNTLPALGVAWKTNFRDNYDSWTIFDFNILDSALAGFEEPYAYSLFLGKLVKFGATKEEAEDNNGYAGYLISYGDYHIRNMLLIPDRWLELEWKVKGTKVVEEQKLDWSFRVGCKWHEHPNISNTVYFGIRRSNVDLGYTIPFISNSSFEYRIDITDGLQVTRNYLTFDKKFPLMNTTKTISLLLGFIQEYDGKYTGSLVQPIEDNFKFIIRPNITF